MNLHFKTHHFRKVFRALLSTGTKVLDPSLYTGQEFNANAMHIDHILCFAALTNHHPITYMHMYCL